MEWSGLDSCGSIESTQKKLINEKENMMTHFRDMDLQAVIIMKL